VDFIGTKQNKQITFLHRLMYSLQLLFSIVKICQKVKLKIKNSKMKFFCRFSIVRSEKNERKNLQIPIFSFQCSQIFTTSKLLPRNPLLHFPFESCTFFWVRSSMHLKLMSPKERVNTTPRLLSWIHSVRMWMTLLILSKQNHSKPIWSAQLVSS